MPASGLTKSPVAASRHFKGVSQSAVTPIVIYEGWLLKKRRKKMQGMLLTRFMKGLV